MEVQQNVKLFTQRNKAQMLPTCQFVQLKTYILLQTTG